MKEIRYIVTIFTSDGEEHEFGGGSGNEAWGNIVYEQLMSHKDIDGIETGHLENEIIIPYHAIVYAIVTRQSSEAEVPADNFCGGDI